MPIVSAIVGASVQIHSGQTLNADRRAIDIYLLEQEHKSIAEHIVALVTLLLNDDDDPNWSLLVRRSFERLEGKLQEHLENESTYIATGLHGECEGHQADHRTFQRAVVGLRRTFELAPSERGTAGVASFLRNWWMSHVNALELPNLQQCEYFPAIRSGS